MSTQGEAIKLLVLHDSVNHAEQLTNVLRNDGKPTRAKHVDDPEKLHSVLKDNPWDICFARVESNGITIQQLLVEIRRLQRDIPVVMLIDNDDERLITEGLKIGCVDVVPEKQSERLLYVTLRELKNLQARRRVRKHQSTLNESEKRAKLLLTSSRDAIAYLVDGVHVFANEVYLEKVGFESADDIVGFPMLDILASKDQKNFKEFLRAYNKDPDNNRVFKGSIKKLSGEEFETSAEFSSAHYDGEACTQIIMRTSIAKAELNDQLQMISSQDLVTGLHNRQYFSNLIDRAIERAVNNQSASALIYMQIDKFSELRNQVGLNDVDGVLSQLAVVLKTFESDSVSLARFGDHSFTFIAKIDSPEPALEFADSIRKKVANHIFEISDSQSAQITACLGVAMVNDSIADSADALSKAFQACEKILQDDEDGNAVNLYEADIASIEDESVIKEVRTAIEGGRFKLLYQAIVSLKGDEFEFYEVFLRMINEDDEEVSPADFLSAAAEAKLTENIDRWVITQSLKELAAKQKTNVQISMILNVSGQSVTNPAFLSWLEMAVQASGVKPKSVIIQVTETDANDYLKHVVDFFTGLRTLGVQSSVSRFGLGVNPENALNQMKPDFIKMDGSFTNEIRRVDIQERIKEISGLAKERKIQVINTFVENATVLSSLWQLGVHFVQGYYLHAPHHEMTFDFSADDEEEEIEF